MADPRPSRSLNLTDRLFLLWFAFLSLAILIRPHRVHHPLQYLLLHLAIIASIVLLARNQDRNRHLRFWHDWYPLLLFILAFEETARLSFLFRDRWQDHLIIQLESRFFSVPPTIWLQRFASPWFTELMELGYFSFYVFLILVGGVLYARAHPRVPDPEARSSRTRVGYIPFRALIDANVLGYIICFLIYLFFPTESPARTLAQIPAAQLPGGPFHFLVNLIQHGGGVHGNAFPSGHIMSAAVTLAFALRYTRRLGLILLPLFLLMCVGAIYDGYHYLSDVLAGALLGFAVALLFLVHTSYFPRR